MKPEIWAFGVRCGKEWACGHLEGLRGIWANGDKEAHPIEIIACDYCC